MDAYLRFWRPGDWPLEVVVSQFIANWRNKLFKRQSNRSRMDKLIASRPTTILFTDIAGFSLRMAARSQEEVVSSLDRYFQILSRCVHRHHGRVDKFIGDGMMAVFDEPDDAVRAAFEIQDEVARFNIIQLVRGRCTFPTRIAVNTGPVIVTRLSARPDQGQTVLGQAVNVAAHLAQQAPPDRVFISQSTRNRLKNSDGCNRQQLIAVKGQLEPIIVYEI